MRNRRRGATKRLSNRLIAYGEELRQVQLKTHVEPSTSRLPRFSPGSISFLSPCVLPLVPGYLSLISGAGLEELKAPAGSPHAAGDGELHWVHPGLQRGLYRAGSGGDRNRPVLGIYKHTLARVAGVIIILFGLHLTGIFKIKALYTDARLHSVKGSSTPVGAFVIGFAFAFGWTPCLGPILTAILTVAGNKIRW